MQLVQNPRILSPMKVKENSQNSHKINSETYLVYIVKYCSACFNRIARKLGAMGTEPENPIPDEGQREQPEHSQGK